MLVDPRFSAVADKFFALTKAQPHGGASLAVYKNGAPVLGPERYLLDTFG